MDADNQQERLRDGFSYYISGFVDGEGTFHIAIQKTSNVNVGYQLIPEFRISQREDRAELLYRIRDVFQCGYIKQNHARNLRDKNLVYTVRNKTDLWNRIIPFFRKFPLQSMKHQDFLKFSTIVEQMLQGKHLKHEGLRHLLRIVFSMNRGGKYRTIHKKNLIHLLESSETIRQTRAKSA
ncbi:LAGLIDADG family homing endonuclease [Candidatus Peregrinibacteria bacterium]|nr:LAGLIDADG family homing endonuclease [Candidatus Peregrinibacteria bacterium]